MYGPYSEVQINPNRNQDEEGLPFINDPSNIDNFNDSARELFNLIFYPLLSIQIVNSKRDMCKINVLNNLNELFINRLYMSKGDSSF